MRSSSLVSILAPIALIALAGCSSDPKHGTGDDTEAPVRGAGKGGDAGFGNADASATASGRGDGGRPTDCIVGATEPDEFGRPPCPTEDAGTPQAGPGGEETGTMDAGTGRPPVRTGCEDEDAGCPLDEPGTRCVLGGRCKALTGESAGKLDLLFMVDNSGSMREEQALLRDQMPTIMRVLTSGDRNGDGIADFVPAEDLHLGVVSSDMGLVGISGIPGCDGLGDDGVLNNIPDPSDVTCQPSYPSFLTYTAGAGTPQQLAANFGCVASLGTEGCGFEQQLESALKAITPSTSPIRFLGDVNGFGQLGHADGANAGFVRTGVEGRSVVALIMVTDEEDCSSVNTRHFTPNVYLDPSDPLAMQDLNLRCFFNPQNLYPLTRYVTGFRNVRPDAQELVIFGAIVGVPPDLVDQGARSAVDFNDAVQRDAYYDRILADSRMQAVPDPASSQTSGNGNLTPSCVTASGRAYPPRRFVQVAKQFGSQSIVQSICQSDFAPVMDAIVEKISASLGSSCLATSFPRSGGEVACEVVFELAPQGTPGATVHSCADLPYLSTPSDRPLSTMAGRRVCMVDQVPVTVDPTLGPMPEPGLSGFYYDDFSAEAAIQCGATVGPRRIAFAGGAAIPDGASAYLDCAP